VDIVHGVHTLTSLRCPWSPTHRASLAETISRSSGAAALGTVGPEHAPTQHDLSPPSGCHPLGPGVAIHDRNGRFTAFSTKLHRLASRMP
jgi:hypothetical protein